MLEQKLLFRNHLVSMDSDDESEAKPKVTQSFSPAKRVKRVGTPMKYSASKSSGMFRPGSSIGNFRRVVTISLKRPSYCTPLKKRRSKSTVRSVDVPPARDLFRTMSSFKIFARDTNNRSWEYFKEPAAAKKKDGPGEKTEYIDSCIRERRGYAQLAPQPRFYKRRDTGTLNRCPSKGFLVSRSAEFVPGVAMFDYGQGGQKKRRWCLRLGEMITSCDALIDSHRRIKRYSC